MQRILNNGISDLDIETLNNLFAGLNGASFHTSMQQVADYLGLAGICVAHNIYDKNHRNLDRNTEVIGADVRRLDTEKVIEQVESSDFPVEGKCIGPEGHLDFWGGSIKTNSKKSKSVIFFGEKNKNNSLADIEGSLPLAACMLSLAQLRLIDKLTIKDLQHNMRYQVIWAECLEWLKSAESDDERFFRDLITRTELLTESTVSALYTVKGKENEKQWLIKGLTRQQLIEVNEILPEFNLFEVDRAHVLNDIGRQLIEHGKNSQLRNLMVIPMYFGEELGAIFYLGNKAGQLPFGMMDEVYVSQILAQAYTNIERHQLLAALSQSNKSLQKEKTEQQKLITKLQSTQSQLLQSEKMASIGQLAAGVAHEINNPIGFVSSNLTSLGTYTQEIIGVLDKIENQCNSAGNEDLLQQIQTIKTENDIEFLRDDLVELQKESLEGISRVKQIVQDLKDFSHVSDEEMVFSDLHRGLDSTLNIVSNELKYIAKIDKQYGEIPLIQCVPSQINQVLMNLLVNAGHAIDKSGIITIRTEKVGDRVEVTVSDNGHGIEQKNIKKLFEPFFTTKPVGKGTGLGLSLSYSIVNKHNGLIEVASEVGKGTAFTVTLPIQQPEEEVVA